MSQPLMSKADWRRAWRARRQAEKGDQKALWREVDRWLAGQKIDCLGIYMPMDGEPDLLDSFMSWSLVARIPVALPFTDKTQKSMTYRLYKKGDALGEDTAGIVAPLEGSEVRPSHIVVPCVGFHPSGRRLGYGGGYVDRYIEAHPDTRVLGVAWHWSMVPDTVFEAHDKALSAIVTDRGRFGV